MPAITLETGRGYSSSDTGNVSLTNTTTETTLYSTVVRGGAMGTNKSIRLLVVCDLTTPLINLPNLTIAVKFGVQSLMASSTLGLVVNMQAKPFFIDAMIVNKTNGTQFAFSRITQDGISAATLTGSGLAVSNWTADTSVDNVLAVTAKFNMALPGTVLNFNYGEVILS